ncbi:hypothetical protein V6Z11_A05G255800 [Gossypium hirsutum]
MCSMCMKSVNSFGSLYNHGQRQIEAYLSMVVEAMVAKALWPRDALER